MGGLGHYLEREGLATAQISLIRVHTEKIRPPRALWVPFELGRPLGAPDEPAFQTRVLRALLGLLDAEAGPVLADFPDDAPEAEDMEGWSCPVNFAAPPDDAGDLRTAVTREIAALAPWHDLAQKTRGATTGATGAPIADVARFLLDLRDDPATPSPWPEHASAEALKHASEDLKAFYLDAATAKPGHASTKALSDWLWNETAVGDLIRDLRQACLDGTDDALREIGQRFRDEDRPVPIVTFTSAETMRGLRADESRQNSQRVLLIPRGSYCLLGPIQQTAKDFCRPSTHDRAI